jgi:hypothetical protein
VFRSHEQQLVGYTRQRLHLGPAFRTDGEMAKRFRALVAGSDAKSELGSRRSSGPTVIHL